LAVLVQQKANLPHKTGMKQFSPVPLERNRNGQIQLARIAIHSSHMPEQLHNVHDVDY
jgi:hypothetical protein